MNNERSLQLTSPALSFSKDTVRILTGKHTPNGVGRTTTDGTGPPPHTHVTRCCDDCSQHCVAADGD